ncbi:peptide ABC transporter substrate-binding protein [Hathewaya histolytica]|uniref:Peptide ABC transporter substrate-binding protein n=1 Tax=Hathewaya histolytica TaxID=1498 RepID=A0A4V6KE21_HATHI|nr:peptide ABC transporter substrate-binding protein [Hathewaya histolytica]VTQ92957.1 peptide ABC transporter substrate-binding protein [Hathewaya histolytica]
MKSKKLTASLLALMVVTSSALMGCGGQAKKDEDKKETAEVAKVDNDSPKDAEQHYNAHAGEPNTLDPVKSGSNTAWSPQGMIYEGLTRYQPQPDGSGKIEPGVAESWEMSKDGLKYTFKLRKNAKWSDGKPVTAKDFVYSWRRVVDPKVGSGSSTMFNGIIKNAKDIVDGKKKPEELGIKAVDDNTFEVELENPCGYFMELTYFAVLKPVRQDYVEKFGSKYGTEANTVIGNAGYVLKEWVHKNRLVFEKNENYWDKDTRFLTKVTWKIISDTNAKMQSYQNGEIDAVFVRDGEWIEKFKQDDNATYSDRVGNNVEYFLLNCKNKYLKNDKVRKALNISFDREDFCKNIINGLGAPTYGLVPDGISLDGKPYKSLVKNDHVKQLQEENKDAKKLLTEGLKELGLPEDPSKVNLTLFSRGTDEKDKQEAEFFQQQWRDKLGVNIKIEQMDYNIMYDRIDKGDFEIAIAGWFADWNDPSSYLDNFNSVDGYYKTIGWTNKEYDETAKKAKETMDLNERVKLYEKAEKILMHDESAIIPIYVAKNSTFRRKYIKNFFSADFGFGDYKNVYISGKKK